MESTTATVASRVLAEGQLRSLYAYLQHVPDRRAKRGRRYEGRWC